MKNEEMYFVLFTKLAMSHICESIAKNLKLEPIFHF